MQVDFSRELEQKLRYAAASQGRGTDTLLQESFELLLNRGRNRRAQVLVYALIAILLVPWISVKCFGDGFYSGLFTFSSLVILYACALHSCDDPPGTIYSSAAEERRSGNVTFFKTVLLYCAPPLILYYFLRIWNVAEAFDIVRTLLLFVLGGFLGLATLGLVMIWALQFVLFASRKLISWVGGSTPGSILGEANSQ